jgi:hypothetical protein
VQAHPGLAQQQLLLLVLLQLPLALPALQRAVQQQK